LLIDIQPGDHTMSAFQVAPAATPCRVASPSVPAIDTEQWSALLDRIASGDRDAMGAFYDESAQLAYSLILHILHDREAADDALVDLYADVHARACRNEHHDRHPVSWMIDLARRWAFARRAAFVACDDGGFIDDRRHEGHAAHPAGCHSVLSFPAPHRQPPADAMLGELGELQRSIVQLTFYGGLTVRQVAQQLSLPRGLVGRELHSALCTLRAGATSGQPCAT
jgi:RNA polymerase sigma-70 factor (ECF subfamily)